MKILLLLSESWNDVINPNNNLTNWFSDFPQVEIRTISGSSQTPFCKCCKEHFLIGENDMIKSLFTKTRAGKRFTVTDSEYRENISDSQTDISNNTKIKSVFSSHLARLLRDIVWRFGKYNTAELRKFIEEFNPDIIFSQRKGSVKMCRLEKTVSSMTNAPLTAYTGDDEYSLKQFSLSPFFWIHRLWVRRWLKKVIPTYKLFYSQSKRQMDEFKKDFGVNTKFLVKCGTFSEEKIHREIHSPIELSYIGKLYCNRWKSLSLLAKAVKEINEENNKTVFRLNIYTKDKISKKQDKLLNDKVNSVIRGGINPKDIPEVHKNTDILLHVEGLDLKNSLLTKDSFSTKVMDCMASGCAVMIISRDYHAAYRYLKEKNSAFVASSPEEIKTILQNTAGNTDLIKDYAEKVYACGKENHQRRFIQNMILTDFMKVIQN